MKGMNPRIQDSLRKKLPECESDVRLLRPYAPPSVRRSPLRLSCGRTHNRELGSSA